MPNATIQLRGLPEFVRAVTVGSNLRVLVYVAGADNLPLDPTASEMVLRVKPPTGNERQWGPDPDYADDLEHPSVGNFYADTPLDEDGEWVIRVELTGDYNDADERTIRVPASALDPLP